VKKNYSSRKIVIFALFLVAWLVAGCGTELERSRKPSEDWSRGLLLGTNAFNSVGMAVDQDSKDVHAVWFFWEESKGIGLRYVQIDQTGKVQVDQELMQFSGRLRSPRLIDADKQHLHLFWADYSESVEKWQLWYAQLDKQGTIKGTAERLSRESSEVSQYEVVPDNRGGVVVVWGDAESGGINLTRISSAGAKEADTACVVARGTTPSARVDDLGQIHLVWWDDNENLMYQQLDAQTSMPVDGTLITHVPFGTGASLEGPVLGLADQRIYVFWSILNRSGLEAGTAKTEHVTFPVGAPKEASTASEIWVLPLENPPYQPAVGDYTYSQLVPADLATRTSKFVYAPTVGHNQRGELAVALATEQEHRLDSYIQIVVAVMADGEYKGYTLTTKTQAISSDAVFSADSDGNFHMFWREGFDGKNVYYTTTAPDARSELDRFHFQDVVTLILEGGMESMAGILLFPFAFLWMFPSMILLVGWRLIRNDEDLTQIPSRALLAISVILYQVTKMIAFPTMVDYVPFSAWIDIPSSSQLALRLLVPLFIFGVAFFVAERFRRKSIQSTMRYFFSIVIVDTILTLAIYGVNFMGEY